MEPASTDPEPLAADAPARGRGPRLLLVGWLVAGLVLATGLGAVALRVHDTRSALAGVDGRIADGKRPAAPALDGTALEHGVDNPGLPAWWRTTTHGDDHVLVVNFWASWCGPCREEAPMLDDVARAYADRGVVVLGADPASEDAAADARDFVREYHLDYPMVRVTRGVKDGWGVQGFPETFVVGRDHRISAHVNGPVDEATLRSLLDHELRAKRNVA